MHSLRAQKLFQNVASLCPRNHTPYSLRTFQINSAHQHSTKSSLAGSVYPTSRVRYLSTSNSSSSSVKNHRTDIFYHPVNPPTPLSRDKPVVALSFLSTPHAVIGWIPATSAQSAPLKRPFGGFVENPQFRELMHRAVQDGLQKGVDDIQINGALHLQEGWMHIHDDRNIPPIGRIGDPDDIIASVLVQDSKIVPETYQPMPSYRLCTSDGLTKLTPGLQAHLLAFLEETEKKESSSR